MNYRMREKMFAIGDDYLIETDGGQPAFKVGGKALRIRGIDPERGVRPGEEAEDAEP
jgi:hypothetical protein